MPRQIGLGASLLEHGVDGDIDFDFFDENKEANDEESSAWKKPTLLKTENCRSEQVDSKSVHASCTESEDGDMKNMTNNFQYEWHKSSVNENKENDVIETIFQEREDHVNHADREIVVKTELSRMTKNISPDYIYENGEFGDDSDASLDVTVSETDSSSLSDDSLDNLSDSEITDVTPLSSTNNSPLPSSPNHLNSAKKALGNSYFRRRETVKFVNTNDTRAVGEDPLSSQISEKSVDLKILLQAILDTEKEPKKSLKHERSHSAKAKKNLSFSNDEVRRIDRENQLLLKKIFDKQQPQRVGIPTNRQSKISSSSINRIRQQRKIEAENLMLLKRIQSVRPTKELSRMYLLKSNHHHHHHYHHHHHHHHNCCPSTVPSTRPASQASSITKNKDLSPLLMPSVSRHNTPAEDIKSKNAAVKHDI